jgi:protein-S-isoprenylcysteine O-methyltransferase Ste14
LAGRRKKSDNCEQRKTMTIFEPGMCNAWLLSLPFFGLGVIFMGTKMEIAKRMSDLTGYSAKEKSITVAASLSPYPFMLATLWTPFTTGYLAIAVWLQHFMILAEERVCREKYGAAFEKYLNQVPRYLCFRFRT